MSFFFDLLKRMLLFALAWTSSLPPPILQAWIFKAVFTPTSSQAEDPQESSLLILFHVESQNIPENGEWIYATSRELSDQVFAPCLST